MGAWQAFGEQFRYRRTQNIFRTLKLYMIDVFSHNLKLLTILDYDVILLRDKQNKSLLYIRITLHVFALC